VVAGLMAVQDVVVGVWPFLVCLGISHAAYLPVSRFAASSGQTEPFFQPVQSFCTLLLIIPLWSEAFTISIVWDVGSSCCVQTR